MRLMWLAPGRTVALWWTFLAIASSANISLWYLLYWSRAGLAGHAETGMLYLCAAYVFGCAFRSFIPRADVQRFCLFDTWLSNIVIGRSVATVAELCFAAQWALMLDMLGRIADVPTATTLAQLVVPMILVAQVCSWYGVLTTNTLANAIENSIWAVTFGLIGGTLMLLVPLFDGLLKLALVGTIVGIGCYIVFLAFVDIPMYVQRRCADQIPLSLRAGLRDASTRRIVTHDFSHWRQEIPWMSLYFTVAVWMSLLLGLGAAVSAEFPRYLSEERATSAIQTYSPELGVIEVEAARRK